MSIFEWQQTEHEAPVLSTLSPLGQSSGARTTTTERLAVPDFSERLPKEIAPFTCQGVYNENSPHASFVHGGGHGGSHPHLCHEFIRAIIENRPSRIDASSAAEWCSVGICAHASAMQGGRAIPIPSFT